MRINTRVKTTKYETFHTARKNHDHMPAVNTLRKQSHTASVFRHVQRVLLRMNLIRPRTNKTQNCMASLRGHRKVCYTTRAISTKYHMAFDLLPNNNAKAQANGETILPVNQSRHGSLSQSHAKFANNLPPATCYPGQSADTNTPRITL